MSIQYDDLAAALAQPEQGPKEVDFGEWDLDISIVESGPSADKLIRMTDDGCQSTCATACTSCP